MIQLDLYKLKIVTLDEKTRAIMRTCPEEAKQWTTRDVTNTLYAFAMCQIPRSFWYQRIKTLPCGETKAVKDILQYVEHLDEFVNKEHVGLLISGSPGVGKTFLASHIAKQAVQRNFSVWFYDNARFTDDVMKAMKNKDVEHRLNTIISKADILIIDNLGRGWEGKIHPLMCNKLESILEVRHKRGATIFTMLTPNVAKNSEVKTKMLPERLVSLIQEMMHVIKIQGVKDMRQQAAKNAFKKVTGA